MTFGFSLTGAAGIAAAALLLAGCHTTDSGPTTSASSRAASIGSSAAAAPGSAAAEVNADSPTSEIIPLKLPPGALPIRNATASEVSGAVLEQWLIPYEGPNAMTESQVIGYLRTHLPVGRPYTEAGLDLKWCGSTDKAFAWKKPGQQGPAAGLQVHMLGPTSFQIDLGTNNPTWPCETQH